MLVCGPTLQPKKKVFRNWSMVMLLVRKTAWESSLVFFATWSSKIEGDKTMLRIYDFDYASNPPPEFLKCSPRLPNHNKTRNSREGSHDFGVLFVSSSQESNEETLRRLRLWPLRLQVQLILSNGINQMFICDKIFRKLTKGIGIEEGGQF